MNSLTFSQLTNELIGVFLLSVVAFVVAMALTPVYTDLAYRYKFWKKQRDTSTTGEKLLVFVKLHQEKFKRNIPTMAGVIGVVSIAIVTLTMNLDRAETYLPLAALIGGGIVGLLDDIINIRGQGTGVAGLRSSAKFLMITALGLALGWWFFQNIGVDAIHIPFLGDIELAWAIIPVFAF
ncbi:hypothetical protein HY312_02665, partial [Candidatus Saccharibacteria bacterium]|nr:hypothetical protein [Candidatus Saccharibacteria bacterium]